MLIYIDTANYIRVYRVDGDAEGRKRAPVGRIAKASYDFIAVPEAVLTGDEERDIRQIVEIHRTAKASSPRVEAMGFPELARRVTEYYTTGATEVERRLIATAVLQMVRSLRKVDNGQYLV